MNYTVNDAVTILYRCGIQTIPTLLKHLHTGGFQIAESTLAKKVRILRDGNILEDGRVKNKGSTYLTSDRLKRLKDAHTEEEPESSAVQLCKKTRLKCTPRTISNGLQKLGLKYMRIATVPFMKEVHIQQRLTFATAHEKDRLWRRTFFLDESKFQAFSHKKYCYQDPKKRITKPRPKYPPKVNAIGMIS